MPKADTQRRNSKFREIGLEYEFTAPAAAVALILSRKPRDVLLYASIVNQKFIVFRSKALTHFCNHVREIQT
jgi:hypothetical protein